MFVIIIVSHWRFLIFEQYKSNLTFGLFFFYVFSDTDELKTAQLLVGNTHFFVFVVSELDA